MATCPTCGNKGFGLKVFGCSTCNRPGCVRCLTIPVGMSFPDAEGRQATAYSCSWDCFDRAVRYQMSRGQTVSPWGEGYVFMGRILTGEAAWRVNRFHVENLVLAGRYEDAARLYERLGLWKEAGDMRSRMRQQVVTQVHVNMNDLLEQLQRMGLSATYTCPACRSPLSITGDMRPDALTRCAHCGSMLRQTDIVDAVTRVLSAR